MPPRAVEGDRVAVGERERRRRRAAARAAHAVGPDALDDRRLVLGAALRADLGAVRIAVEAALDHAVVARRRRARGDDDRLDPDRDRVADLGALDVDRQRHLVAALDRRRDHRPPAAGSGVGDDVAAVADRAEHLGARPDDAVAEAIDVDGLRRRRGRRDAGRSWPCAVEPPIGASRVTAHTPHRANHHPAVLGCISGREGIDPRRERRHREWQPIARQRHAGCHSSIDDPRARGVSARSSVCSSAPPVRRAPRRPPPGRPARAGRNRPPETSRAREKSPARRSRPAPSTPIWSGASRARCRSTPTPRPSPSSRRPSAPASRTRSASGRSARATSSTSSPRRASTSSPPRRAAGARCATPAASTAPLQGRAPSAWARAGASRASPTTWRAGVGGTVSLDLFQKNVTLLVGYAFGHDTIGRSGTPFDVFSRDRRQPPRSTARSPSSSTATPSCPLVGDVIIEQRRLVEAVPLHPDVRALGRGHDPGGRVHRRRERAAPRRAAARAAPPLARSLRRHRRASRTASARPRCASRSASTATPGASRRRRPTCATSSTSASRVSLWPHARLHLQTPVAFWQRAYVGQLSRRAARGRCPRSAPAIASSGRSAGSPAAAGIQIRVGPDAVAGRLHPEPPGRGHLDELPRRSLHHEPRERPRRHRDGGVVRMSLARLAPRLRPRRRRRRRLRRSRARRRRRRARARGSRACRSGRSTAPASRASPATTAAARPSLVMVIAGTVFQDDDRADAARVRGREAHRRDQNVTVADDQLRRQLLRPAGRLGAGLPGPRPVDGEAGVRRATHNEVTGAVGLGVGDVHGGVGALHDAPGGGNPSRPERRSPRCRTRATPGRCRRGRRARSQAVERDPPATAILAGARRSPRRARNRLSPSRSPGRAGARRR